MFYIIRYFGFRLQIVRKHPKQTATENAAFTIESSLVDNARSDIIGTGMVQFPTYRCLSLTSSLRAVNQQPTTPSLLGSRLRMEENRCFQQAVSESGLRLGAGCSGLSDLDSVSMAYDEVPPPYEAVIVSESNATRPVASFNSSLSTRLANYSFRSSREFQI